MAGGPELSGIGVELTPFPVAPAFAFAALPATAKRGMIAVITNSDTATWGDTVLGGGADVVLAWYDGSAWVVIGASAAP